MAGFLQRLLLHAGSKQQKEEAWISSRGSPSVMSDKGHATQALMLQYPLCNEDLYKSQNDTLAGTKRLKESSGASDKQCPRISKLSY